MREFSNGLIAGAAPAGVNGRFSNTPRVPDALVRDVQTHRRQPMEIVMRKATCCFLFVVSGCGEPRVRPDEMSAEAHRTEAVREEQRSASERARYSPAAEQVTVEPDHSRDDTVVDHGQVYNPTQRYLSAAGRDDKHARQHLAAAAKLESFEQAECAAFAPAVRVACPANGPITRVEDTREGVRLYFAHSVDLISIAAHMRCHLAFARAEGFDQSADCPLYLKGVSILVNEKQYTVELNADTPAARDELRRRARETIFVVPDTRPTSTL